ncbi:MAG: type II secretion system protein [Firmicutes bacterium]|nr:type II secretion system protein [Bacillota bacterium]
MKNKKGFTLIELLAVIVILGLLMAIAIPSVTKYITQSRKKTVVSTIGNYISAAVNEVNDLTYTFTGNNTVYAVPIECIALERGGTNPFGHWLHANDAYWAYVLVQYDDETSSYTYGYTFKDSAGYGLYPTSQAKLNEQGKQIQTGLSLTRPANGKVTTITSTTNWSGFSVDSSTDLVVLAAMKEGEVGNGKTTCTLLQKDDNYASIEQDRINDPNYGGNIGGGSNNNNDGSSGSDDDNVVVTPLLTFKIDGKSYSYEDGMTLTQWINSSYNTDNFIVEDDTVYTSDKSKKISGKNGSSKIEKDGSYTLTNVYTGGGVSHVGGSN